jgi:hypothetical protein
MELIVPEKLRPHYGAEAIMTRLRSPAGAGDTLGRVAKEVTAPGRFDQKVVNAVTGVYAEGNEIAQRLAAMGIAGVIIASGMAGRLHDGGTQMQQTNKHAQDQGIPEQVTAMRRQWLSTHLQYTWASAEYKPHPPGWYTEPVPIYDGQGALRETITRWEALRRSARALNKTAAQLQADGDPRAVAMNARAERLIGIADTAHTDPQEAIAQYEELRKECFASARKEMTRRGISIGPEGGYEDRRLQAAQEIHDPSKWPDDALVEITPLLRNTDLSQTLRPLLHNPAFVRHLREAFTLFAINYSDPDDEMTLSTLALHREHTLPSAARLAGLSSDRPAPTQDVH